MHCESIFHQLGQSFKKLRRLTSNYFKIRNTNLRDDVPALRVLKKRCRWQIQRHEQEGRLGSRDPLAVLSWIRGLALVDRGHLDKPLEALVDDAAARLGRSAETL